MHDSTSEAFRRALRALELGEENAVITLLGMDMDLAAERGDYHLTLLHQAAAHGCTRVVEALLDLHVDPNIRGNDDGTPLHWAASMGQLDTVRALVARGADHTLTDGLGDGGTPLIQALMYGHREVADYLDTLGRTPDNLRAAAGLGDLAALERLTGSPQAGAGRQWYRPHTDFPDWPDKSDSPQEILDEALCYACANAQRDAVGWLVQHGAEINAVTWHAPPLFWAVGGKHADFCRWLVLEYDACTTTHDKQFDAIAYQWAHHTDQPQLARWFAERTDTVDAKIFLEG